MSVDVLQPLQHVSHRGAHNRGPQDSVHVKRSRVLLVGLKHPLHLAADGVANPEEGGSVGKMGCQAVSQKREEVRLIYPLLASGGF